MNAPPNVMFATLETIHFATVCVRNWTMNDDFPCKVVNEMMDAIHAVPQMLHHWDEQRVDMIRLHLRCFDTKKWRQVQELDKHNIPDLVQVFDDHLAQYEKTL